MLDVPRDSVLAILADFGPSLLAVAPFVPALILALALLALATRPEPVAELPQLQAIRCRRQMGFRDRPEALVAGLLCALALLGAALARSFHG